MPAALAVIPFVLLLPTLISIPNYATKFIIQDELIVNSSQFSYHEGTGPAMFQRKLVGIAKPLYAELSEGVMSYHVKLYHEHNLQKVYYYTENCTASDITVTTNRELATTFVIQTGDKFYHKGGKFTIGCTSSSDSSLHLLGIRQGSDEGLYLTADDTSTGFKIAVGEITPYYMRDIV